jgi:alkylation response protein AidB-like acyl-CoA dehydrogenase
VPRTNIVGKVDGGWTVATALLDQERTLLGSPLAALRALETLRRLVAARHGGLDARERDLLAQAEIEVETLTAAFLDALDDTADGNAGAMSAYLKILATETTQFVLEVVQDVAGECAGLKTVRHAANELIDCSEMFLHSRRTSIYGGSNEIQRSLIASRVLDLRRGGA